MTKFVAPPAYYADFYDYDVDEVARAEVQAALSNPNAGLPVGSYMPHELERLTSLSSCLEVRRSQKCSDKIAHD